MMKVDEVWPRSIKKVLIEVTINVKGGGTIIYRYWDERKYWHGAEFDDIDYVEEVLTRYANDGDVVIPEVEKIVRRVQKGNYTGTAKVVKIDNKAVVH